MAFINYFDADGYLFPFEDWLQYPIYFQHLLAGVNTLTRGGAVVSVALRLSHREGKGSHQRLRIMSPSFLIVLLTS